MEDSQIINLYFERNSQAIQETQKKYNSYCVSIARNILSDMRDVEESINQTWFEAWKNIPPKKPDILSAYLGGITRNISLNMIRGKSAQKRQVDFVESYDELDNIIGSGSVEDEFSMKELAESVNRFVGELPEIQRKVFICRYWYFDKIEDIGNNFGFSKGKVKSILHRTRKNLQKHLKEEGLL